MTDQQTSPNPWNLPNAITVARIFFAPVVIWMLLADAGHMGPLRWWAAILFVIAMVTDGLDGYLARSRGLVTDFGKIADPIADKGMVAVALIGLSIVGELPWWVTVLILLREVGITVYRMIVISRHVVAAAWAGKVKTVVQVVAITLALVPLSTSGPLWLQPIWHWASVLTMAAALVLTAYSGAEYMVGAYKQKQLDDEAKRSVGDNQ